MLTVKKFIKTFLISSALFASKTVLFNWYNAIDIILTSDLLIAFVFASTLTIVEVIVRSVKGVGLNEKAQQTISTNDISAIEQVALDKGWEAIELNSEFIKYRTKPSIWSFGETVTIRRRPESLSIRSRSSNILNIFDFGKNVLNIRLLQSAYSIA